MSNRDYTERRQGWERRQNLKLIPRLLSFKGNRRYLRRKGDRNQIVLLDQYSSPLLFAILAVLGLSLLDAVLTLVLIERGAVEVNPVMNYYLSLGHEVFVIAKYSLTAVSLVFIVVLDAITPERFSLASLLLPFSGLVFFSVVAWELYLLSS